MNDSRTVGGSLLTASTVEKVADVRLESFFSLANPPRNLRTTDGRGHGGRAEAAIAPSIASPAGSTQAGRQNGRCSYCHTNSVLSEAKPRTRVP